MDKFTLLTSFGKWVEPLESTLFDEMSHDKSFDRYTKKLTTKRYVLLFLYAQLQNRSGLRAISDDLLMKDFQKEIGLDHISPSQLSRKNRHVDSTILSEVWQSLILQIRTVSSGHKRTIPNVQLLDSSTVPLSLNLYKWAKFRETKSGLKLHLLVEFINERDVLPTKLTVSPAERSDIKEWRHFITEPGVTYVFDRGYFDFMLFDAWCKEGIYFATRIKSNTVVDYREVIYDHLDQGGIRESLVKIGSQQNKMKHHLRLIEFRDEKGKFYRIITNRFDLSAHDISELYRSRWQIELQFKWMKQHLQVNHIHGRTEQAAWNQLYIAMIAYSLLVLVKLESKTKLTMYQIFTKLRALVFSSYSELTEVMLPT
ncbi:IS4 family transposase [Bacillus fonticola]|uniref:IS4 family transposase n=1 Tax=Bacillus fonticola TaxID=2728853 RepID=UPI0014743BF6|nr:IS4 family transposase [Bacillus fonticola]